MSFCYNYGVTEYIEEHFLTAVLDEKIDTTIITPKSDVKGKVLFVHGAGESTKERVLPLARALARRGWKSLAFSLPGHGNSSGELMGSTLVHRAKITRELAKLYDFLPSDIAVGVSMGAHTIISLLEDNPKLFSNIVLFVPGAYSHLAEEEPFGPGFTAVLKETKSYHTAKAWDILPKFQGNLVTVEAGRDKVIPPDVYTLIHHHAKDARKQHVYIRDTEHQISFWLAKEPGRVEAMADAIDTFDFSPLADYGEHRLVS